MEKQGKQYIMTFFIIVIILSILALYLYIVDDEVNPVPSNLRNISTGDNDFWNRSTNHPSWALNVLQTSPLLIFTHSEGCAPCITQTSICESLMEKYSAQIEYFDYLSGVDLPALESFSAYDPDGEPHYIPLITVVTKGPNDSIIWHSWEGVVEELVLASWIEDAISYHNNN